jgi:hypothetical protein
VSNISVFPSFFFVFCALALALSLPFDATGPLSAVQSSPPPPRCRPLFVYSQSAPPIVVFTSVLDYTPTLAAQG